MKYQILQGDNRDTLKTIADNSIDAIVTDPPYGIDFLGKSWDANTGALETYQECLRVLKPGGHILAFSAARTYHHLAVTLEQAGFEIRDQIMWIYSSGFPKSQDIGKSIQRSLGVKEYEEVEVDTTKNSGFGMTDHAKVRAGEEWSTPAATVKKVIATDPEAKAWSGWGTALKPAHEPIALARKPIKGSIKDNVLKHGVGALNIEATRVSLEDGAVNPRTQVEYSDYSFGNAGEGNKQKNLPAKFNPNAAGRFPSNVLGDIPDYQKYFYCPKVSRKERHIGLRDPGALFSGSRTDIYQPKNNGIDISMPTAEKNSEGTNNHPTVKPIELMKYLIKLVTPPGGTVLDPFNGSGSTGCAAVELGHQYIGCELDPAYVEIATKRIAAWNKSDTNIDDLFE